MQYIYIYTHTHVEISLSYTWCNSGKITYFLHSRFLRDLTIEKKKNH